MSAAHLVPLLACGASGDARLHEPEASPPVVDTELVTEGKVIPWVLGLTGLSAIDENS